ncbi:MAG: hypothetical protein JEZ11_11130 [Desulfobacterales bacterium]|nr:hypothetical protein [Desulfobacterales bacterium]
MIAAPPWRAKLALLLLTGVPAFTGYPLTIFHAAILPGLTWAWIAYGLAVNILVAVCTGRRIYGAIAAVAALVALPVVFGGAAISFLLSLLGWGAAAGPADYSPHYVALCVTMLTVVPLALGLVAVIPMGAFEQSLLQHPQGVSRLEKCLLMFLRVFNHIVFEVIPSIIEVIREERHYHGPSAGWPSVFVLVNEMVHVATAGICTAVQFIPLWALEISQLPDRKTRTRKASKPVA